MAAKMYVSIPVFLYVPNIIGYFRLLILAVAWWYIDDRPKVFLSLYVSSVILDGFDGYFARLLDQTSVFGAWFDVVIDNIGRGMLWSYVFRWGWMVSCLEWLAFVCTHSLGASWKTASQQPQPLWVQAVMANGFKTPLGVFAVGGLHLLPIWFYAQQWRLYPRITPCMKHMPTVLLGSGRVLCCCVELWFIYDHIMNLAELTQSEPIPTETQQPQPRAPKKMEPELPQVPFSKLTPIEESTLAQPDPLPSLRPKPAPAWRNQRRAPARKLIAEPPGIESEPSPSIRKQRREPLAKEPRKDIALPKQKPPAKVKAIGIALPAGVPIPGQAPSIPLPASPRIDKTPAKDTSSESDIEPPQETTAKRGPFRRFSRKQNCIL